MAAVAAGEVAGLMPSIAEHFLENVRDAAASAREASGMSFATRRRRLKLPTTAISPEVSNDACLAHDHVARAWRCVAQHLWGESNHEVSTALDHVRAAETGAGIVRSASDPPQLSLLHLRHLLPNGLPSEWVRVVGGIRSFDAQQAYGRILEDSSPVDLLGLAIEIEGIGLVSTSKRNNWLPWGKLIEGVRLG